MGVNSLPKTVTLQRRGCDLNPGPSVPDSSTLTTQLLIGTINYSWLDRVIWMQPCFPVMSALARQLQLFSCSHLLIWHLNGFLWGLRVENNTSCSYWNCWLSEMITFLMRCFRPAWMEYGWSGWHWFFWYFWCKWCLHVKGCKIFILLLLLLIPILFNVFCS